MSRVVTLGAVTVLAIALAVAGIVSLAVSQPDETIEVLSVADLEGDDDAIGRAELFEVDGNVMLKLGWQNLPDGDFLVRLDGLVLGAVTEPGRYEVPDDMPRQGTVEMTDESHLVLVGELVPAE